MNERIKELIESVRKVRSPDAYQIKENGVTIFFNDELEKFAELIVRECRKVIADNIYDNSDDDFDLGLDHARQIIGEHFGVEK